MLRRLAPLALAAIAAVTLVPAEPVAAIGPDPLVAYCADYISRTLNGGTLPVSFYGEWFEIAYGPGSCPGAVLSAVNAAAPELWAYAGRPVPDVEVCANVMMRSGATFYPEDSVVTCDGIIRVAHLEAARRYDGQPRWETCGDYDWRTGQPYVRKVAAAGYVWVWLRRTTTADPEWSSAPWCYPR